MRLLISLLAVSAIASGCTAAVSSENAGFDGPRPDGMIVFVAAGAESSPGVSNTDAFAVSSTGTHLVNLTHTSNATEQDMTWSSDGSKVLFTRTWVTPGASPASFHAGIFTMNADGSTERQVLSYASAACPYFDFAWSPDGSHIAFVSNRSSGPRPDGRVSYSALQVMDADGSDLRTLCGLRCGQDTAQPTWSPDGRTIVFSHAGVFASLGFGILPSPLWIVHADGSGLRQLTDTDRPLRIGVVRDPVSQSSHGPRGRLPSSWKP